MSSADELIIADGGSADNTDNVVKNFLHDSRVVYFSEPDRGFSDAVSKALLKVKNPIVGIMSSDDAYVSNIREKIINLFKEETINLIYGDYEIINKNNRKIGLRKHKEGTLEEILSLRVLLPQSSVFFRMSAVDLSKSLNLKHDYIADVVLFNQICIKGGVKYLPEILSQVRRHEGSRTGKRNPGVQYLDAINTVLSDMPISIKRKAEAGALLLRARYEASSNKRLIALKTLFEGLYRDVSLVNHWLLPRTAGYMLIGSGGMDFIKRFVEKLK